LIMGRSEPSANRPANHHHGDGSGG
jgi:hypothetical protein